MSKAFAADARKRRRRCDASSCERRTAASSASLLGCAIVAMLTAAAAAAERGNAASRFRSLLSPLSPFLSVKGQTGSPSHRLLHPRFGRGGNHKGATSTSTSSDVLASSSAASDGDVDPETPVGGVDRSAGIILVAGSANVDTFLHVAHLPREGENLTVLRGREPIVDIPGGKGCNQAAACAALLRGPPKMADGGGVSFLGRFGNDSAAVILRAALSSRGVDLSYCEDCEGFPSGRGYVFVERDTGKVSAVVSGGSNERGWGGWEDANADATAAMRTGTEADAPSSADNMRELLRGRCCLLLQREVPECVNLRLARAAAAAAKEGGAVAEKIIVLQDVGGEDRPMSSEMMRYCDYLIPNETELERLVRSSALKEEEQEEVKADVPDGDVEFPVDDGAPKDIDLPSLLRSARSLQRRGANHVLVTLGSKGSLLVPSQEEGGSLNLRYAYEPACLLPPGKEAVDETGAGDCYRAAFAVALTERREVSESGERLSERGLRECMRFASAAGALAVTKEGAVPSIPTRDEVEELLWSQRLGSGVDEEKGNVGVSGREGIVAGMGKEDKGEDDGVELAFEVGDGDVVEEDDETPGYSDERIETQEEREHAGESEMGGHAFPAEVVPRGGMSGDSGDEDGDFPLLFGSRINSMKDRPDLWSESSLTNVRDWLHRQATVRGLGCVDFNYPQHFHTWTPREARDALDEAGLKAGAVCLRYPSEFARGAMIHPDPDLRRKAIEITKEAAEAALILGCDEVVVWSAYDGYDYPFQVDYDEKWKQIVDAFRECCDAYPNVRWSLEFKPTDENTRFFTVPSTGAALLLLHEIDRPNMGLTLDVGHMLMAGENPAQSIAMVGDRLFGLQLNDGYTRLAAEDGMIFGSIHPSIALEIIYQLQLRKFRGHLYFDTFPQRTDPVKEAEYNIRRVKQFWRAAEAMDAEDVRRVANEHDALGALELVNRAIHK